MLQKSLINAAKVTYQRCKSHLSTAYTLLYK